MEDVNEVFLAIWTLESKILEMSLTTLYLSEARKETDQWQHGGFVGLGIADLVSRCHE
jgi:hypothetical protein